MHSFHKSVHWKNVSAESAHPSRFGKCLPAKRTEGMPNQFWFRMCMSYNNKRDVYISLTYYCCFISTSLFLRSTVFQSFLVSILMRFFCQRERGARGVFATLVRRKRFLVLPPESEGAFLAPLCGENGFYVSG